MSDEDEKDANYFSRDDYSSDGSDDDSATGTRISINVDETKQETDVNEWAINSDDLIDAAHDGCDVFMQGINSHSDISFSVRTAKTRDVPKAPPRESQRLGQGASFLEKNEIERLRVVSQLHSFNCDCYKRSKTGRCRCLEGKAEDLRENHAELNTCLTWCLEHTARMTEDEVFRYTMSHYWSGYEVKVGVDGKQIARGKMLLKSPLNPEKSWTVCPSAWCAAHGLKGILRFDIYTEYLSYTAI